MRRFIFTGAPGAGKTTILIGLQAHGLAVVEEAATDVNLEMLARGIAEPWRAPGFIEVIAERQIARQREADRLGADVVLFDRSPVCTHALARYLGLDIPAVLRNELESIARARVYDESVFFVESLGFITPTEVRRIDYAGAQRFAGFHRQSYADFGYRLVPVAPDGAERRVAAVRDLLARILCDGQTGR